MNYSLYTLGQLEHMAYCEDNHLALAIYQKGQEEKDRAIEEALDIDGGYSYGAYEAADMIHYILSCEWHKIPSKDKIIYMMENMDENYHIYSNQVKLSRDKGSEMWKLEILHGEKEKVYIFVAAGYKDAQRQAVDYLIKAIRDGVELNRP